MGPTRRRAVVRPLLNERVAADIAELVSHATHRQVDRVPHLAANDSYGFHVRLGSLLRTGPTNTNVSDVTIVLVR